MQGLNKALDLGRVILMSDKRKARKYLNMEDTCYTQQFFKFLQMNYINYILVVKNSEHGKGVRQHDQSLIITFW